MTIRFIDKRTCQIMYQHKTEIPWEAKARKRIDDNLRSVFE